MKSTIIKNYVLQAYAADDWRPVVEFPETGKNEAISLMKYKKGAQKGSKWRVILRTVKERKVA